LPTVLLKNACTYTYKSKGPGGLFPGALYFLRMFFREGSDLLPSVEIDSAHALVKIENGLFVGCPGGSKVAIQSPIRVLEASDVIGEEIGAYPDVVLGFKQIFQGLYGSEGLAYGYLMSLPVNLHKPVGSLGRSSVPFGGGFLDKNGGYEEGIYSEFPSCVGDVQGVFPGGFFGEFGIALSEKGRDDRGYPIVIFLMSQTFHYVELEAFGEEIRGFRRLGRRGKEDQKE
jgi:hypothetical protein